MMLKNPLNFIFEKRKIKLKISSDDLLFHIFLLFDLSKQYITFQIKQNVFLENKPIFFKSSKNDDAYFA